MVHRTMTQGRGAWERETSSLLTEPAWRELEWGELRVDRGLPLEESVEGGVEEEEVSSHYGDEIIVDVS